VIQDVSPQDRPWSVLVPITVFYPEVEAFYAETPDLRLEFALAPEERIYGGGDLGPAEQRRRATEAIHRRIGEVDVVGAIAGPPFITADLMDRAPKLRAIYIAAAGHDSIDVAAATERGIVVVNSAGNNVIPVSEHVMGLMLALVRKIALADRISRRERRGLHLSEIGPFPGMLRGRTLGLVGLGRIGSEVARMAGQGFRMRVVAYDPYAEPERARALDVLLLDSLEELLESSDIVSIHLPLTEATWHAIGAEQLARMKPGAFLINTSRGPTIDTDALLTALAESRLAGAGLDVTDPEPLPRDHPLLMRDDVVLTPHAGGGAAEAVLESNLMVARSLRAIRRRTMPEPCVNPEVWPAFLERYDRLLAEELAGQPEVTRPPAVKGDASE
jgi:D-3-phosphoglycerate dehydrogenase / 2-oxoglutarate reductase